MLQLLFSDSIMPEYDVARTPLEFSIASLREQPCYERYLSNVFCLLPNIAFGLEILCLRQTSYQVIHELKNKLIAAQSWLNCLEEDVREVAPEAFSDANVAEDVELTLGVAREGAELAKSYLQFTKLYNPQFRTANVNRVIEETAASLRAFAAQLDCAVAVETDLDDGLPAQRIDPEQMKMALFNLGKNALEALQENGVNNSRIRFAARAEEASLAVAVRDNGPGMPEEVARVLFKPFASKKEGGTGLGLAITKKIVDIHGGTIRCETGKDGTEFVIELRLDARR